MRRRRSRSSAPACGISEHARGQVLRRVRQHRCSAARGARRDSRLSAERKLVSVLFADLVGFTSAVRDPGRRGHARAPLPLLRHLPAADRAVRRHGREVHRRRGDGGLGNADRDRGRRRAGGAGRARPGRGGRGARRRGRRARASRPGRRPHRRGGGDARRRGAGHGRRRPGQHGLADPVAGRARLGARRRGDAARDRADDRLRGRGLARAEGQGGPGPALAGAARRLGRARRAEVARASRRRSSGRDRELRQIKDLFHACADERKAHLVSITGIAGIGKSRLGWEFYKYFDGLAADHVLAPRPLPLLRRGRHLLGARRHGADARPDRRGRGARPRRSRSCADVVEEHVPDARGAAASSSRGSRTCSGSRRARRFEREDLFAAWRLFFERLADVLPDGAASSRTCSGRTHRCSTSSSTCSSGRGPRRSSSSRWRGRSCWSGGRPGGPGSATSRSIYLEPLSERGDGGAARRARARACRRRCAARSSPAPRAFRCTRSRPCACCSTAGALVQEGAVYRPTGTVEALEVPETLHALIAARLDGLTPEERRLLQDGAVLGKTFTQHGARGARRPCRRTSSSRLLVVARRARRCSASRPTLARPSTASTGSSRTCSVASPTRRSRGATGRSRHLAAAAHLEEAFAESTRSSRSSRRTTSTPTRPTRTPPDAAEIREKARARARAGRGARRVARRGRGGAALLRAGGGAADEPLEQAELLERAGEMAAAEPRTARRPPAARALDRDLRGRGRARTRPRASRAGSRRSTLGTAHRDEALARMERALRRDRDDEPDEDLALLAGAAVALPTFSGDLERAAERVGAGARDRRGARLCRSCCRRRSARRRRIAQQLGAAPRRPSRSSSSALELALEHDLRRGGRAPATSTSPTTRSGATATRDALGYLDEGARARAGRSVTGAGEWASLAERRYPLLHARPLGRGRSPPQRRVHRGAVRLRRRRRSACSGSELEIHCQRGRARRRPRRCSRCSRGSRTSTDVQDRSDASGGDGGAPPGRGSPRGGARGRRGRDRDRGDPRVLTFQAVKHGFVEALEAALALGDPARARGAPGARRRPAACGAAAVPRRPRSPPPRAARRRRGRSRRLRRLASARSAFRSGSPSRCSSTPRLSAAARRRALARRGARDLRAARGDAVARAGSARSGRRCRHDLPGAAGRRTRPGSKFCGECGAARASLLCMSAPQNAPGRTFCGECGAQLGAQRRRAARRRPSPSAGSSRSSSPTSSASRRSRRPATPEEVAGAPLPLLRALHAADRAATAARSRSSSATR